jgi:formate-dependent nitrite reductase membrane component NrfD
MHAESTGALTPGSRPGHTTHLVRHGQTAIAMDEIAGPSYYDIPLLKKPVWSWEIGCYFFLGGLSAGSYLLARVAERLGGARYRAVTRAGTAIAVTALLPCPILLIDDLGHRSRFHHMLRVFKPRSPMNLGSWVLTGYSGVLFLTALREWLGGARQRGWFDRAAVLVLDAAGLPLALFFSGYTGVLLSATSTPVWCRNPWLGPLFTASAISNAVSTISVALQSEEQSAASEALDMIDTVAHVGETVMLTGYLSRAGGLARPLTHGANAPYFWGAVAGLAISEVLKHVPAGGRTGRWPKVAAAGLGVLSGLALKWSIQEAGAPSASDPDADRQISRARR